MSVYTEARRKSFPVAAAATTGLGAYLRVLVGSDGTINLAGSTDVETGTTERASFAAGGAQEVVLHSAQGTSLFTAADAITKGNTFYAAASGKVSNAGTIAVGIALESTTADGDTLEGMRIGPVTASGSYATLTGIQTLTNKTLTAPVIGTGLTASGSASNDFSGSTGTFKTSTGANTLGGALVKTSGTVAAAGTNNTNGGAITKDTITVSAADATKGVVLPTGVAGMEVLVINTVAAVLKVYPAGAGTINGVAAGTGVALTASAVGRFVCTAADTWYGTTAALLASN